MKFDHTVGSHSDDRGGDSDLPCHCQYTTQPDPQQGLRQQLSDILFKAAGGISDMAKDEIEAIIAAITARDAALIAKITDLFENAGGIGNPLTTYSHTFYGKDSFDEVGKFEAKDAVIRLIEERKK